MEINNENNNITVINCFVHIPITTCNFPINWMQIKEKNSNDILLNIPYTSKINIKNYTDAVYKVQIHIPESINDHLDSAISLIHEKYKMIIYTKQLWSKFHNNNESIVKNNNKSIHLNIDFTNIKDDYTLIYFLTKLKYSLAYNEMLGNNIMRAVVDDNCFKLKKDISDYEKGSNTSSFIFTR